MRRPVMRREIYRNVIAQPELAHLFGQKPALIEEAARRDKLGAEHMIRLRVKLPLSVGLAP